MNIDKEITMYDGITLRTLLKLDDCKVSRNEIAEARDNFHLTRIELLFAPRELHYNFAASFTNKELNDLVQSMQTIISSIKDYMDEEDKVCKDEKCSTGSKRAL